MRARLHGPNFTRVRLLQLQCIHSCEGKQIVSFDVTLVSLLCVDIFLLAFPIHYIVFFLYYHIILIDLFQQTTFRVRESAVVFVCYVVLRTRGTRKVRLIDPKAVWCFTYATKVKMLL